jgi:L-seryl-tRNA(Ser) seleniumtransferase
MARQDVRPATTAADSHDASPSPCRQLPAVNELADSPALAGWISRLSRPVVVEAAREVLGEARRALAAPPDGGGPVPSPANLIAWVAERLEKQERPRLRPVINATGIVLHTGLGRAPLAAAAVSALAAVARQYAAVEVDLDTGERGKRTTIVRELLCRLTGAESATVVNNNAAATLITLAALGHGRSIIVSRGELIEIGGSFRLPEIMEASGARLRDVGTTNKTRIADYERAIDETTAGLMKVHTSNYRITGFTEAASIEELVALGKRRGLPIIHDIGSGAMIDYARFGFTEEPVAAASVRLGADLTLFSGDKLLGGPQAGIILGRREWIERIERHPLMRAFRVDKMTLAALDATLRLYRDPELACREVPILALIATPVRELKNRAEKLATRLRAVRGIAQAAVANDTAFLGGGSIPDQGFATVVVRVRPQAISESELAARLRLGEPAVVPRVHEGAVVFDLRTVFAAQDEALISAVAAACAPGQCDPLAGASG